MARVLVVDDAVFMRKLLSDTLAAGGHEVVGEASNGHEAIALYGELGPDVVTLDITMPELDGLAALEGVLAVDPTARVVMCSALGHESKVTQALNGGACDFVSKPFVCERLRGAIARAAGE